MPLVDIRDLTFSYVENNIILSSLTFELDAGQCLLVVGDNGSGKTTLGHLLAGLLKPTNGTVRISQEDPFEVSVRKRCRLTSCMGQVSHLSVITSSIAAELGSFARQISFHEAEQRYLEWAKQHALPLDLSLNPRDLTTPELWRLVLGFYGIILTPTLLVIDEVFCASNERQQRCLADLLNRRREQRLSTIVFYQRILPLTFDRIATLLDSQLSLTKT